MNTFSPPDEISHRILMVRGKRVMLDADLACVYGVPTHVFNQAIKRNRARFPADFSFHIDDEELKNLISQFVISSGRVEGDRLVRHGGRRKLPWVFTEHGCLMAATVLRSPRAIEMSLYIIRAFVRIREEVGNQGFNLRKFAEIDRSLLEHDAALRTIWERLQPLLQPAPEPTRRRIGFLQDTEPRP